MSNLDKKSEELLEKFKQQFKEAFGEDSKILDSFAEYGAHLVSELTGEQTDEHLSESESKGSKDKFTLHRRINERLDTFVQTCVGCPEQYEGKTESGQSIYVRCRHGYGYIELEETREILIEVSYSDGWQGFFDEGDLDEMLDMIGLEKA